MIFLRDKERITEMMKRIFAVLLLGCLLCLALAGCGKSDLEKSQSYMDNHPLKEKKLYSVSFCLVTDDAIDPFVLTGMQKAFNEYSEANYNIHVEFTNKTATQYATWLENEFKRVETAHAARLDAEAAAAANPTPAVPGSSGSGSLGSDIRDVYPEIAEDQFDIIYIADYSMLSSLVRAGRLRDLTAEMNSKEYRLIKKQMTESFFDKSVLGGKIYAVPNCRVMSNYKYMRINVEKAKEFNYLFKENFTDSSSTNMLSDVLTNKGYDAEDYIQKNKTGELLCNYNYRYVLEEDGAWWVYASANEQLPKIKQSDLMNGMLAITSYAYVDNNGTNATTEDDVCPAVRILYAINTERALHTILQYGVPGLTYNLKTVVDDEGNKTTVVSIPDDADYTYNVDPKYTGNIFSLYPTEEEYENNTQYGNRMQNIETVITKDIFALSAVSSTEGCTATVNASFGKVGETVTFTATPAEGYHFVKWYVMLEDTPDVLSTNAVYQHEVESSDIEITAEFAADGAE